MPCTRAGAKDKSAKKKLGEVAHVTSQSKFESVCVSKGGLCLIALLDPDSDSHEEVRRGSVSRTKQPQRKDLPSGQFLLKLSQQNCNGLCHRASLRWSDDEALPGSTFAPSRLPKCLNCGVVCCGVLALRRAVRWWCERSRWRRWASCRAVSVRARRCTSCGSRGAARRR